MYVNAVEPDVEPVVEPVEEPAAYTQEGPVELPLIIAQSYSAQAIEVEESDEPVDDRIIHPR